MTTQNHLNEYNLPENLTPESAFYACDGPKEQRIADLKRIIRLCDGLQSQEADALCNEAYEFLEDLEA